MRQEGDASFHTETFYEVCIKLDLKHFESSQLKTTINVYWFFLNLLKIYFPNFYTNTEGNKISNFLFITNIGYYCTIQTLYSNKFWEFSDRAPTQLLGLHQTQMGEPRVINLLETP